jgi:transketolase
VTVVAPGDDWEAAEATSAMVATPGTCYLRLDRSSAAIAIRPGEEFVLGRARVLRDGEAYTLVSTGGMLGSTMQAADMLDRRGVQCRVLSMHTVRPLDANAVLAAARDTGGVITIEEHVLEGGLGGAVAEVCLEASVRPVVFHRIGIRGGFTSIVGSQEYLRHRNCLDPQAIAAQVLHLHARMQDRL